ncbi:hypothetical protein [uncultured Psychroserpens sp.]|uniref:SMP-30/gluconolactonase/LRE family protein n=1 Tax=uncultured Psychroserpens sp. TaxID=255436 RepID=UPI00260AA782|nr:hypothetical protein [uncultured Psychroserpens sp.]
MKKIILPLLLITITLQSCEKNQIEDSNTENNSYNISVYENRIEINTLDDKKGNFHFTENDIKKSSKTTINTNANRFRVPGFLSCFYGFPTNVINCLQDYVGTPEILYNFNPQTPDNPESVAIDSQGNFIISMALSGELIKIDPAGNRTLITLLPIGDFIPGAFTGLLGAIAVDNDDNIYVNVNASEPSNRGVWKVSPTGVATLIGLLPLNAVPNGISLKDNMLYIADSGFDGKIWRVSKDGGTPEIWADDPLLKLINPGVMAPGPNGIQYYNGEFYVSNPNQGLLLAITLDNNSNSGALRIVSDNTFFDDFAIDALGNIIGTTDPFNTVEKIYPDGTKTILLSEEDGLDGPTAAIFGTRGLDRYNLYITNAAFPFFTENFQPSLMKLELGIPGAVR